MWVCSSSTEMKACACLFGLHIRRLHPRPDFSEAFQHSSYLRKLDYFMCPVRVCSSLQQCLVDQEDTHVA